MLSWLSVHSYRFFLIHLVFPPSFSLSICTYAVYKQSFLIYPRGDCNQHLCSWSVNLHVSVRLRRGDEEPVPLLIKIKQRRRRRRGRESEGKEREREGQRERRSCCLLWGIHHYASLLSIIRIPPCSVLSLIICSVLGRFFVFVSVSASVSACVHSMCQPTAEYFSAHFIHNWSGKCFSGGIIYLLNNQLFLFR